MKKYTYNQLLAMKVFNNLLVERENNYHPQDLSIKDYMKIQILELQELLNKLLKLSRKDRLNFDEGEIEAMSNVFTEDKIGLDMNNLKFNYDFNKLKLNE